MYKVGSEEWKGLMEFFGRIDLADIMDMNPETTKVLAEVLSEVLEDIEIKDGVIKWGEDEYEIPTGDKLGELYAKIGEERSKLPKVVLGLPGWTYKFEKAINEGELAEGYRKAAKDWEGDIVIHILPYEPLGLPDLYMYMGLEHGKIRHNSLQMVTEKDANEADYIITGAYDQWMEVASGKLKIVKALMKGTMTLKGDLKMMMKQAKPAKMLIEMQQSIPSISPDEFSDELFDLAKMILKKIGQK